MLKKKSLLLCDLFISCAKGTNCI